jgi:F-type H+-transporting ATPase subunit alpha
MKKVSGTLRLDLAQYRNLEAFAKFGSDLDPATQRQLNRGARLVEVLKQGQYEPVPVEEQVAIIYVAGQGFIDDVPVAQIREFEAQFREALRLKHADVLASVSSGAMSDEAASVFEREAKDLASSYVTAAA